MRPLSEPLLLVACRLQVLLAVACRTNPKLQLPVCLIVAKSLRRDGGDDSCDFRGCNIESKRDFTSFVPNHLASSAERETERLRRGSHVVVAQTLVKHWSASEINPTATVLEEQESCCAPYALRRAQERPCLLKLSKTYHCHPTGFIPGGQERLQQSLGSKTPNLQRPMSGTQTSEYRLTASVTGSGFLAHNLKPRK